MNGAIYVSLGWALFLSALFALTGYGRAKRIRKLGIAWTAPDRAGDLAAQGVLGVVAIGHWVVLVVLFVVDQAEGLLT